MTWRIKAVHEDGAVEWLGAALTSLGAGLDVLERIKHGTPETDFETYIHRTYGPRWYLSIDHGPEAPPPEPTAPDLNPPDLILPS